MKVKVTKVGVTFESGVLDVGTVIDVTEDNAKHLLACGVVEVVEEPKKGTRKAADK